MFVDQICNASIVLLEKLPKIQAYILQIYSVPSTDFYL